MKTLAIVQARMGSSRFPGKVIRPVHGKPMIERLLTRLQPSQRIDKIIVATGEGAENQPLETIVTGLGFECFRGSENDVLERFHTAAKLHEAQTVVRITGDCPLVDPALVDAVIDKFHEEQADYCSNVAPPTFPDGLDVEVFTFSALEKAASKTQDPFDREHVTPYLRNSGSFKCVNFSNDTDCSNGRWTVDEPQDMEVVEKIFMHFSPDTDFRWQDVMKLHNSNPDLFAANSHFIRNEGSNMGSGQKLWKRAKSVIPGGNMLLSKRSEMFLPEHWPSYFSKAKGCTVWDMDGKPYKDMLYMGIGTNTLGYGHPEVDEVVMQTVANGNLSTLNCPEEVWLAEALINLHPWAGGARFTRAGGEANSVAIRIARAASGKDGVAICGYHGWHDWYLSANLGDNENLAGHLLPGLSPNGVPQHLRGSTFPFEYNKFDALEKIVTENRIGVIKMEVTRNMEPEDNFLHRVRELATKNNIVLVFDECTSGFRQTFGGLHKQYGVEPDMAVFGKTLGNGYAINAVIGRDEIMQHAQSTFISSTFWTERIGPTAALKTLEVMEREKSWETITAIGEKVRDRWQALADRHGLEISHYGLASLAGYSFKTEKALEYKTYITQEMLKSGFLAGTALYACTEHDDATIDEYFAALEPVFATLAECENGRNIEELLEGPVCHGGFRRLN